MPLALLDTDILSELLKQKNATVVGKAAAYLAAHGQFALSALTRYEIIRGLREKGAAAQLLRFEAFCRHSLVLPLTDAILDRAADL
jgi:tRNA(fMet)-specific endonuclease VapC